MYTIKVYEDKDGKSELAEEYSCKGFGLLVDNEDSHDEAVCGISVSMLAGLIADSEIFIAAAIVAEAMIRGHEIAERNKKRHNKSSAVVDILKKVLFNELETEDGEDE